MNQYTTHQPTYDVLVVEPDPDDERRFRKQFDRVDRVSSVSVVSDGETALEFVRRRGEYATAPVPNLVLLALDSSPDRGYEFLSAVKTDPDLRSVPVITMSDPDDVERAEKAYDLCTNAHISKPSDAAGFDTVVRMVTEFWLDTAQLPQSAAESDRID